MTETYRPLDQDIRTNGGGWVRLIRPAEEAYAAAVTSDDQDRLAAAVQALSPIEMRSAVRTLTVTKAAEFFPALDGLARESVLQAFDLAAVAVNSGCDALAFSILDHLPLEDVEWLLREMPHRHESFLEGLA